MARSFNNPGPDFGALRTSVHDDVANGHGVTPEVLRVYSAERKTRAGWLALRAAIDAERANIAHHREVQRFRRFTFATAAHEAAHRVLAGYGVRASA